MPSIYDPSTYPQGVPNPLGPRVHAWTGGPFNEGQRFHGPVYTRPQATLPWQERPLWGVGSEPIVGSASRQWWDDPAYQAIRVVGYVGSLAGTAAGAYHGYKRNGGSVGWGIGWALLGGMFWPIALPIMFVQGFGERK